MSEVTVAGVPVVMIMADVSILNWAAGAIVTVTIADWVKAVFTHE